MVVYDWGEKEEVHICPISLIVGMAKAELNKKRVIETPVKAIIEMTRVIGG